MMFLPSRSRFLTFAAGFLAAASLSGVITAMPGLKAAVTQPNARTFNIDQLMHYYPKWMALYDLNHNGLPDFAERGETEEGLTVGTMFVNLDGGSVPYFCLMPGNESICGTPAASVTELTGIERAFKRVPEVCDDGVDNENDGMMDCADAQCDAHPSCASEAPIHDAAVDQAVGGEEETGSTKCTDSIDNDLDGWFDRWDSDCAENTSGVSAPVIAPVVAPTAPPIQQQRPAPSTMQPRMSPVITTPPTLTTPTSGGSTSQAMQIQMPTTTVNTQTSSAAIAPIVTTPVQSYDQVRCPNPFGDANRNGVLDASDPYCFTMTISTPITTIDVGSNTSMHGSSDEICTNRMDDNNNTLVDCADTACESAANCQGEWSCNDNKDNDGNGKVDCLDLRCATDPAC